MSRDKTQPPVMAGDPGDSLAARLRSAVCSEAYEEILSLLSEYGRRLDQQLQRARGDVHQIELLIEETGDLLRWARATMSANRAHAQTQLSRLGSAAGYRQGAGVRTQSWLLEG